MGKFIAAIDQGTTSSRCILFDQDGSIVHIDQREHEQITPKAGWVEHDATEIWKRVREVIGGVLASSPAEAGDVEAIGITNQRETAVVWDRETGEPVYNAIVWQDTRTAPLVRELAGDEGVDRLRDVVGLPLSTYFSGPKVKWILDNVDGAREKAEAGQLAFGNMDTWVLWNLTGGTDGGVLATEPSNASRTMLFDIRRLDWDDELCGMLHVPPAALPEVVASSGRIGVTSDRCGVPGGIPISGVAGDQQAALFGQACIEPGMAKNTYGTGSFVLLNVGEHCPQPAAGMLTTVAWMLGDGAVTYALEGAVFSTGSAVQWLRDGLGLIASAAETWPLAATVDDSGGVLVVPAFTGLGSPWWDPYARGTIVGITRGTTRAHLARAVVESMAYQTRDVVEAMAKAAGTPIAELRVDGGASAMDGLLQFQADQLGVTVHRPTDQETTALGAAYFAGLAEGVWPDMAAVGAAWRLDASFQPTGDRAVADAGYGAWLRAVQRSRAWVVESADQGVGDGGEQRDP
jgi:glycerol kinase